MAEWTEKMAAQNWCDQFKRNRGRLERADYDYMNSALQSFVWSSTPEGHVVWMKRNRIFNLYFQHPIMNVEALPPDAISCADDPLLLPTPLF